MTDTILEFRGITKTFFGVHALRDISLAVPRGHILGLIGQNGAGKSTLMNILGGIIRPDSGEMLLEGTPYQPRSASDATHHRIAFIHQELNLFTNLSIAENVFIDALPRRKPLPLIDRSAIRKRAEELLESVGLALAPNTLVEKLSPGERQLVEIMKALSIDANIIIFDEPTTSLTARETEQLFGIIERLRAAGKTMIYISHILGDVLQIADDIAVLRDGELVAQGPKKAFDVNRMIALMVGRSIEQLYPIRESEPSAEVMMQVENVCQAGIVEGISFALRKGEVLGIFGLMGSGRTELARILFGLDEFGAGRVRFNGGTTSHGSVSDSIKHQIAFVTENRREEGLLMEMTIADNLTLVSLPQFKARFTRFIRQEELAGAARRVTSTLQIKCGNIDRQAAKSLSGGNQQKVVVAKWLMSKPSIFILDEPTRGIDVGAKYEIYSIINDLAAQGAGVLFISSELEELMGMCDRILVMSRGEIRGEFAQRDFNKENILRSAFREENGHESL